MKSLTMMMCVFTVVAPHWGAWIEIAGLRVGRKRERVAPHWGAWIEIVITRVIRFSTRRRTPLGCVD